MKFQPTLPVRGVTRIFRVLGEHVLISTHTPRAGSDVPARHLHPPIRISTHTPRAGSDRVWIHVFDVRYISTHTPRAGSDPARW